jgi:hypothetical protein
MKRKIAGIFVCMLFISISFSISVSSTCIEEPLKVRIDAKQIYNRIWKINVYVTNSFDMKIEASWSNKRPCSVAVRYLVHDEDLKILTNHFHRRIITFRDITKTFAPGEEKLVYSVFFFGISNWIIPGFADGIPQYISSFPILPEGEYEITAHIQSYRAPETGFNGIYPGFEETNITIHYPN